MNLSVANQHIVAIHSTKIPYLFTNQSCVSIHYSKYNKNNKTDLNVQNRNFRYTVHVNAKVNISKFILFSILIQAKKN